MLGRRRARLAGPRRVRDGGDVAERPDVVVALHAHVLVADDAAVLERQPQARRPPGCARTPAVQTTVRVFSVSPSESTTQSSRTSVTVVSSRNSTPRLASSSTVKSASCCWISGITRGGRVDQREARAGLTAARVALDRVAREVRQLGDPLEPGVAAADEHEAQVLGARVLVVEPLGELEVAHDPVAQRRRLGDRLEADRVLGQPGIGTTRATEPSATTRWS